MPAVVWGNAAPPTEVAGAWFMQRYGGDLEEVIKVKPVAVAERRRGVRYIVGGEVIFHTGSPESCGVLVNIGRHGMLVRTNVRVPEGTKLQVGFTVEGYPMTVQGFSQVVGASTDLLAIKFLDEPGELRQLFQWLEQENFPWTGLDAPESGATVRRQQASQAASASSPIQDERQELEAILPFLDAMG